MNSIIRLCSRDFKVSEGSKGKVLSCGIKGLALVFFWSPGCNYCNDLVPRFGQLPQIINSVKFCLLNINENKDVIAMSQQTVTKIEAVPYIVLYANGSPFLQYDDQPTIEKIMEFVQYSMKLVENKKAFIEKGNKIESDIPPYSIAKGYADFKCTNDGFCYLSFGEAYPSLSKKGMATV